MLKRSQHVLYENHFGVENRINSRFYGCAVITTRVSKDANLGGTAEQFVP